MKQVHCNFSRQTGIPVFADSRLPADRLAVAGVVEKQVPSPDGTRVIKKLSISSVTIRGLAV